MDVDLHIQHITRAIQTEDSVTSFEIRSLKRTPDNRAVIKLRIGFYDDSVLEFTELVDTSPCYPVYKQYAYQYMKNDLQVFRYDNYHLYPELPTSPQHKHVGPVQDNRVEAKVRPSHSQLFKEIRSFLDVS